MWLVFSILTVLLWGTSDVIFKSSSVGERSELKLLAVNGIVYGTASCIYGVITHAKIDFDVMLKYFPIAATYICSMLFYYKALPLIKVSVASPIANSSCLLTTLLCVFILRQKVGYLQWFAIGMIVVAIIVLSLDDGETVVTVKTSNKKKVYLVGLGCALIYFVLDGAGSFMDDYILDETLSAGSVITAYGIFYLVVGICCYIFLRTKEKDYRLLADKRKLTGSFIEAGGQFTYVYCYSFGDAAIASPFIASFSAVSIILSRIFLKEKLHLRQLIPVLMMLAGMALLSIE